MHLLSPEAYFDASCLMSEVKPSLVPVSVSELHLYVYLACIIALWRGNAIGNWGYTFALTSEGFPFSPELEQGRKKLVHRGTVKLDHDGDMVPDQASLLEEQSSLFSELRWVDRRNFISAAANCALTLPGGSIRYAIGRSPGFGSAVALGQNSPLLTEFDIDAIYAEYQVIAEALNDQEIDLLSPAVVWLSARVLQNDEAGNGV